MESGKFRKKRKGYAQVSNYALTDKNLSLKAKGLYAMIESFLSIPDFVLYKDFLIKQSSDGQKAFDSGWKELKDRGYLIAYKINTAKGFIYEYELLDSVNNEEESTPPKRTPGESTCGKRIDGLSTSGGGESKIIKTEQNKENNIKINNTNTYNINKEDIINDFYYKASDVDFNEINNFPLKAERFDKLLHNLSEKELQNIKNLDKPKAEAFYLTVMQSLFEDTKIHNKEGYLRTVLNDIDSFNNSYVHKLLNNKQDTNDNC